MAKKGNRVQVILECTEHKDSGLSGTSRYISTKNRKNSPDRLELKKYNPIFLIIKLSAAVDIFMISQKKHCLLMLIIILNPDINPLTVSKKLLKILNLTLHLTMMSY